MTTQVNDPIIESVAKYEGAGFQFRLGMREQFIKDIKRELQPVGNGFRTSSGIAVDLENYVAVRLETGAYLRSKPSVRETYRSIFKKRDEGTRTAHKNLSETVLRKAIKLEGYVFNPGMEGKTIEILSKNFLPEDDEKRGLVFRFISDTEIGALPSSENFTLSELLNQTGLEKHIDNEATKISRLQHKAALRQTALQMAESGSKPAAIETLVGLLENFEKRALKTNRKVPYFSTGTITDEFTKRYSLDDADRSMTLSKTRASVKALDDLTPIRSEVSKLQLNNEPTTYDELKS